MVLLYQIFDLSLIATVALIFIVSLLGAYMRANRRDPCLRAFDGFHITLERVDGKHVWGKMELESTGLELRYRGTIQDESHIESSYILYSEEYKDIRAIFRYVDDLTEENRKKRTDDVEKSIHPNLWRRLIRRFQIFVTMASDSMGEVMGLLVGRLRKPVGRYITDSSEAYLKNLGVHMIGHVGTAHDPLLERYIGEKVVVEVLESGDEIHEHVGIFKNYSPDFIEILDVQFPQRQRLQMAPGEEQQNDWLTAKREGKMLKVTNQTNHPILLQSVGIGSEEEMINVVVDGGETLDLYPESDAPNIELHTRVVRELDMIIPRTRCLVRHRASQYRPETLPELVFDLGVVLRGNSLADARENRLRSQLSSNPTAALPAANLGAILMQRREYSEAEKWLRAAEQVRNSLPDNGRRTQMLLNELARRRRKSPTQLGCQHHLGSNLSTAVADVDRLTAR